MGCKSKCGGLRKVVKRPLPAFDFKALGDDQFEQVTDRRSNDVFVVLE